MKIVFRTILFLGIFTYLLGMTSNGFFLESVLAEDKPVKIGVAAPLGTTIGQLLGTKPELLIHNHKTYDLEVVQHFAGAADLTARAGKEHYSKSDHSIHGHHEKFCRWFGCANIFPAFPFCSPDNFNFL